MPRKGSASKGGKQKRGSKAAVKKEKGAGKAAKNPSEFTSAYGTHSTVRVNSRLDIWWQGEGQWVPCKVVDRSGDAGVGRSRRATRTSSTCDVTVQYDDGTHTHHLAIEPGGSHKLQGHKAVRKARGVLELVPWRPSQNEPFGFDNAVQPGDLIRVYWSKPPPWTTGSDTTSASNRTRGSWHRGTVVDIGEAQCHQTLGESQPGVIRYDIGSRQEDDSTSAKSEDAETIKERVLILHDFSKERWEKLRTTRRRRSSSSTTDVHQNLGSSSSTPPKPSAASNEKKTALRKRSSSASSTPSSARSHRRSVSRKNSMESSPTSPASKSTKSSTSTSSSSSSSTSSASRKKRGASPHVASSSKPAKLGESSPRFSKASSLAASCTAFLNFAIGAAKTVLHPNLTTAPETMPGRTAEHLRLRQFLDACLQGKGQGNNIYLGGRPGTGKTATVKKICTELLREQQGWTGAARALRSPKSAASSSSGKKRKSKSKRESRTVRGVSSSGNTGPGAINRQIMTVLEVNSARDIVQPGDIFEVVRALLQQELQAQGLPPSALLRGDGSGTAKSPGAAKTMLEHYFCGNGARSKAALKRRGMVVLVVDEMENLLGTADMNSNVLHPLFEWARRRESRLILVGISNEIELIEQYLPQLRTRNIAPELLLFRPYSEAQLREILESRVAALHARISQYNKTRAAQDNDRGPGGQRKLPPRTPRKASTPVSSATHGSSAASSDDYEFAVEFDPKALQLCCRKVAGLSGDARKNLSLFWQATDQCLQKLRDSSISQNMCTCVTLDAFFQCCHRSAAKVLPPICTFSMLHAQSTFHGWSACSARCVESELAIEIPCSNSAAPGQSQNSSRHVCWVREQCR
eukprot:INCI11334.2.p1 GENE.INCI11334.2~~INCI11334.2.p1  ORF type:complete len:863 (+),score=137.37 INCI11334.2:343-2931(+)